MLTSTSLALSRNYKHMQASVKTWFHCVPRESSLPLLITYNYTRYKRSRTDDSVHVLFSFAFSMHASIAYIRPCDSRSWNSVKQTRIFLRRNFLSQFSLFSFLSFLFFFLLFLPISCTDSRFSFINDDSKEKGNKKKEKKRGKKIEDKICIQK